MTGRSVFSAKKADRFFPVRVRVAVPPAIGFGAQLNVIYGWLNMHAGRGNFWIDGQTSPGMSDAAIFYFMDATMARAFVDRFACGVVLQARRDGERLD